MPWGLDGSPDGPKSGWRLVVPLCIEDSQAALCGATGRPEMSVFHTLSAGNIEQLGAPGTGDPADAAPGVTPIVTPSDISAPAAPVANPLLVRRLTGVPPASTVPRRRQGGGRDGL